jgi:threonine 3-dehydrogenase
MTQTIGKLPATMHGLKKMQSAPGFELVEGIPVPEIGPTDCLVQVTHAGICGTDRHIYEWDAWAESRVKPPVIVGHEFVGRIAAIGSACGRCRVGDRVSGEGHIGCGACPACRQGEGHICEKVDILGIDRDGCFAEYLALPEYNCWPVPASIPDRVAAIFDPLGNAMHTVMAAGVSGQNVLITGVGQIGLMAVSIAKNAGAGQIFVTDVNERRLTIATSLGANQAFNARDAEWVGRIRHATGGHGVDVLLEMSGFPQTINDGLDALRNGGTAALLGLPSQLVAIDLPNKVIFKGARLLGINGRRMFETWYQVERFLLAGRIELGPILTHQFPMTEFEEAFRLIRSGEAIKTVLQVVR